MRLSPTSSYVLTSECILPSSQYSLYRICTSCVLKFRASFQKQFVCFTRDWYIIINPIITGSISRHTTSYIFLQNRIDILDRNSGNLRYPSIVLASSTSFSFSCRLYIALTIMFPYIQHMLYQTNFHEFSPKSNLTFFSCVSICFHLFPCISLQKLNELKNACS